MISTKKGKKILFSEINDWFDSKGYHFFDRGDGQYIKETDGWIIAIIFNFFQRSSNHFNSTVSMHNKAVESIILEIGLPNINLDSYKQGQNVLFTIQDKENIVWLRNKLNEINLNSAEGYIEWSQIIKEYMLEKAGEFISKNSNLPNVLLTMDEIEDAGSRNYLDLLLGGIDHLFRALIISKLCNDPKYIERQERFDKIILQPKYEKWHPYYEKLKDKLAETAPVYNIGDDNT